MNTYTDAEIGRVLKHRVCARCFGDLVQMPAENRMWTAVCPTCGDAWGGRTVARSTAERRGQQGLAEAIEVKVNLRDLFPSPHKGRNREELVKELGFSHGCDIREISKHGAIHVLPLGNKET